MTDAPSRPMTLDDFVGNWKLNRTVEHHNGDTFVFKGSAVFSWEHSGLRYDESGQITAPNGKSLLAERRYFWQQGTDGNFEVYFDDTRHFHSFSSASPVAIHKCGEDHYSVNYVFEKWPDWESCWRVVGPKKNYTMRSTYKR